MQMERNTYNCLTLKLFNNDDIGPYWTIVALRRFNPNILI